MQRQSVRTRILGALALILFAARVFSQETLLTEKKAFSLPSYTTIGGKTIRDVRVGYETYGKLNATGTNAIFVAHFFTGNSHAAGRYKPEDKTAGYWDAIIGPGKPIDTSRYYVVSADALANLNVKDPNTITTGPATVNPETGKPYGSSFPVITYRDSVRVHRALPSHAGLGSGTQLGLAIARALMELHGADADAQTLARVMGRAKRSAIGTWTFAGGGLVARHHGRQTHSLDGQRDRRARCLHLRRAGTCEVEELRRRHRADADRYLHCTQWPAQFGGQWRRFAVGRQ